MTIIILSSLLLGAAASDFRKHKIYNLWVLPHLAAGFLLAVRDGGAAGAWSALLSMGLSFAMLFPVYLAGGIGAGDVKLFAAAAPFLDLREVGICVLLSFVIGGVMSAGVLLAGKGRKYRIRFAIPILMSVAFIFGGKI